MYEKNGLGSVRYYDEIELGEGDYEDLKLILTSQRFTIGVVNLDLGPIEFEVETGWGDIYNDENISGFGNHLTEQVNDDSFLSDIRDKKTDVLYVRVSNEESDSVNLGVYVYEL